MFFAIIDRTIVFLCITIKQLARPKTENEMDMIGWYKNRGSRMIVAEEFMLALDSRKRFYSQSIRTSQSSRFVVKSCLCLLVEPLIQLNP